MANFLKGAAVASLLMVASAILVADVPKIPVAPATYHLHYSVKKVDLSGGPAAKGTFDVAESQGRILLDLRQEKRPRETFLFDGKHTFIGHGEESGYVYNDFQIGFYPLPIYFPFDFHSMDTYRVKQGQYSNVTLATAFGGGKMRMGATLRSDRSGGPSSLVVGIPTAPISSEEFSQIDRIGGFNVPGHLTLTTYTQRPGPSGGAVSTPAVRYELQLLAKTSTYSPNPTLDFHKFLRQGMLVSYAAEGGDAGVAYDPAKGSFEGQLQAQQVIRTRHPVQHGETQPVSSPSRPWIPMFVAAVFAVAALVVLRYRKRSA